MGIKSFQLLNNNLVAKWLLKVEKARILYGTVWLARWHTIEYSPDCEMSSSMELAIERSAFLSDLASTPFDSGLVAAHAYMQCSMHAVAFAKWLYLKAVLCWRQLSNDAYCILDDQRENTQNCELIFKMFHLVK